MVTDLHTFNSRKGLTPYIVYISLWFEDRVYVTCYILAGVEILFMRYATWNITFHFCSDVPAILRLLLTLYFVYFNGNKDQLSLLKR